MNKAKLRFVLRIVFILYSAFLCYFLFLSQYYGRNLNLFNAGNITALKEHIAHDNLNLIPFATVSLYFKGYASGSVTLGQLTVNVLGNFAALMPLGVFIPYFFIRFRKPVKFIFLIVLLTILIEILQLVLMTGVCDIDDLILNVMGAVLIMLITKKYFLKKGQA